MNSVKEYIASGILELYVMGNTTAEESTAVEQMAVIYPEIAEEIEIISASLTKYARLNGIEPDPAVKPFLLATVDYAERIKNGELVSCPPVMNENTTIEDYSTWLNRDDMQAPEKLDDVYARIIGNTNGMITAIVWIKEMAPQEVHHSEIEKFLIVEGSCEIIIGEKVHQLNAGDVLSIPLHEAHFVKVTSAIPCKIILQRIAA
jgi:mannose-6-phosphate isomerase-like protein (cupin superfamily)